MNIFTQTARKIPGDKFREFLSENQNKSSNKSLGKLTVNPLHETNQSSQFISVCFNRAIFFEASKGPATGTLKFGLQNMISFPESA